MEKVLAEFLKMLKTLTTLEYVMRFSTSTMCFNVLQCAHSIYYSHAIVSPAAS